MATLDENLRMLRRLEPSVKAYASELVRAVMELGCPVVVTSGYRDVNHQTALRRRYEACLARGERVYAGNPNPDCRFPANRPGDSSHNYGLSFDSWVPPEWRQWWIDVRRLWGFTVPDSDWVHAEVPGWRQYVDPVTKRLRAS